MLFAEKDVLAHNRLTSAFQERRAAGRRERDRRFDLSLSAGHSNPSPKSPAQNRPIPLGASASGGREHYLIAAARTAFRSHGRGLVVFLDGRDWPHYSTLEELRESLAFEPEAGALIAASAHALDVYDPKAEAVVVTSRDKGVYVVIVRAEGVETVGGLIYSAAH